MTKYIANKSRREFDSKYIEDQLRWVKALHWKIEKWSPKSALVDKSGNVTHLYIGQKYDKAFFDLIDNGWTHGHCDICSVRIKENDICAIAEENIICALCYEDFVQE